jgi:hypothetical protein
MNSMLGLPFIAARDPALVTADSCTTGSALHPARHRPRRGFFRLLLDTLMDKVYSYAHG